VLTERDCFSLRLLAIGLPFASDRLKNLLDILFYLSTVHLGLRLRELSSTYNVNTKVIGTY